MKIDRDGSHRALVLLALLVAPALFLAWKAWVDPQIAFLAPSIRAHWIVYPDQKIHRDLWRRAPASGALIPHVTGAVRFARDFTVVEPTERLVLRARAFHRMAVRVNDQLVAPQGTPPSALGTWKRDLQFDLTPALRNGANRIQVSVVNADSVPALRVTAPKELTTHAGWQAALTSDGVGFVDAVPAMTRADDAGALQRWPGWSWARWLVAAWILVVAFGIGEALVAWRSPLAPDPPGRWIEPRFALVGVPALLLIAFGWLYIENTARYPFHLSPFDPGGHAEYIRHVAQTWSVPRPNDGWQMFHPPLYYFIAASLYRLFDGDAAAFAAVQFLSCGAALGIVLLSWLCARRAFPNDVRGHWLALGFAGSLPLCVYMAPILSNEVLSGVAIALALYLGLRWLDATELSPARAAALGVAAGTASLVRFTGLIITLALLASLGARALQRLRGRDWGNVVVFTLSVLLVCGWFYGRNVVEFGNPLMSNTHQGSRFRTEQRPGYRTLSSVVGFGSILYRSPIDSGFDSLADGFYASLWADGKRAFFPWTRNNVKPNLERYALEGSPELPAALLRRSDHAAFWMSIAMFLALLPSAAIALGLGRTLASGLGRAGSHADLLMAAVFLWSAWAYLWFALRVPTWSALKAGYLISLVPVLGVCLVRGRALLARRTSILPRLLDACVIALAVLTLWIYRFPVVPA